MPAVVFAAPYNDRSARVVCTDCGLDERHDRTLAAQDAAQQHNLREHAYPEQTLDLDLDLDPDQEITA